LNALRLTGICVAFALGCAGSMSQSQSLADPPAAAANPVHPGDMVRVRIWREPELSGEFPVDETGTVVLPRLGAVSISDESAGAVRTRLVSAYEQFLSHTAVEVTVLRRLQVLGAVRNPGLYSVDPTMTVEDGLALAGGVTTDGSPDRIELIRHGERLPVQLSRRTTINDSAIRSGDQLYVPNKGWISRNPAVAVGFLSVLATIAVIVYHH
jgi:protein involved in polysaccharide export with SLBB domain